MATDVKVICDFIRHINAKLFVCDTYSLDTYVAHDAYSHHDSRSADSIPMSRQKLAYIVLQMNAHAQFEFMPTRQTGDTLISFGYRCESDL